MRASKSEIFGHPDRHVAVEAAKRGVVIERDPKDLTASRLQSELYREFCPYLTAWSSAR